jgi:signal transduction histidine kinase
MKDLMELAEIESKTLKLNLEILNPRELARTVIERYSAAAECKHIDIINSISPDCLPILADRKAFLRILDNLFSNAIRHTPRSGKITISAEEREGSVIFSISDTGEGIAEKHLPNIFGRFVHIEGKPSGGTGLGLAIVKRLVEEQHGQVSVVSKLNQGTTFSFMLPTTPLRKLEKGVGL